ncbi:MAG TPA: hypothetical protein VGL00_21430 [Terracidiphilus sp.]
MARLAQTVMLLVTMPLAAQLKIGETSTSASGMLSSGYNATYGNLTSSTHGFTIGGVGTFSGSYHSPNFLSYNVSPYLNQSRANSNFQSISDASGVNASVALFGGTAFPGSISYSKAYNSEGNYGIPGLTNFVTHGNSSTLGINWSENLADKPSFSAGFQTGTSDYSVYGTNDQGKNSFHSLNLHSGYRWMGFSSGAYYTNGGSHSDIPQIVAGAITKTQSGSNTFGVTVTHPLPMQGTATAGFNRTSWDTNYLGYRSTGTIDTVSAVSSVRPKQHLALTGTLNYSDNLAGQLIQSVIGAGGIVTGQNTSESSSSFDVMGVGTYSPLTNLQTSAFVERRSQSYLGQSYGVNSYGGGISHSRRLLGGSFNGSFNLTANSSDTSGADTIGFSGNTNYSTEVRGWNLTGSFGYAQNVQTLLITYMNSFYNFSGNARKHWGLFNLGAGAGGARTALTQQQGDTSDGQNYNAYIGYGSWVTATGTYSKSSGQALITGAGLVPTPIPPGLLPPGVVSLYGGNSYAFSLASSPVKRLLLSASYAKSISNTTGQTFASSNMNNQFNSLVQYQFRKLYFTSGYARLEQGFSSSDNKPEIISSYYMGISRWFNFF